MALGQRTVLGGVGGQLMQNDCHRLSGFLRQVDMRALNERTLVPSCRRPAHCGRAQQGRRLPMAPAQQDMRIRQRIDASVERVYESSADLLHSRERCATAATQASTSSREWVELGDQQVLVLLAFRRSVTSMYNPVMRSGATGMVVGNEASRSIHLTSPPGRTTRNSLMSSSRRSLNARVCSSRRCCISSRWTRAKPLLGC